MCIKNLIEKSFLAPSKTMFDKDIFIIKMNKGIKLGLFPLTLDYGSNNYAKNC